MMEILSLNGCKVVRKITDSYIVYFNSHNCKSFVMPKEHELFFDDYVKEYDFYGKPNKCETNYRVTICINLSSNCNLNCSYCFNDKKTHNELSLSKCFDFIEEIINRNPQAQKFFVDLSGSGEPLLYIDHIIKIAEFCTRKSDSIAKEVTPMLVSNGLLLTSRTVKLLQDNGILFGVSLDGYKQLHDSQRKDALGCSTYDRILSNINKIESREYIGGAMTIFSEDTDILESYINMLKIFKTVSIRFSRMDFSNFSFKYIIEGYKKFISYLEKRIEDNNCSDLIAIINGDDYFGGMLLKIMSDSYFDKRCDANDSRFALGSDGKKYPCSACVFEDNIDGLFRKNTYCTNCLLEHFCGGICPIQLKKYGGNEKLCEFKKELFLLALEFIGKLVNNHFDLYCKIIEEGTKIIGRYLADIELKEVYEKNKDIFKFSELKKIKDEDYKRFLMIKNQNKI